MKAPILVLCYGNPARQDDGLGPALAESMEQLAFEGVQVESNYQLLVEDAVAVSEAAAVVFVDAAVTGEEPFTFGSIEPRHDAGYMDHSIGPEQLLSLANVTLGRCPEAHLLAIRGYSFEMFKEGLTPGAANNLEKAIAFLTGFLAFTDGRGKCA